MNLETDLIVHLISRIRRKTTAFILDALSKHGLKELVPVHGDVLYALFRFDELSMKEISSIVGRKKSSVTTIVEKLMKLQYVKKVRDENDNRSYRISLTSKGRSFSSTISEISEDLIKKVYKDMPVTERVQLVKSLRRIDDNW